MDYCPLSPMISGAKKRALCIVNDPEGGHPPLPVDRTDPDNPRLFPAGDPDWDNHPLLPAYKWEMPTPSSPADHMAVREPAFLPPITSAIAVCS
jgi:hypothetical protein